MTARLGTRARLDSCPRCDRLVIRALDDQVAAIDVRLEPVPLDPAAELAALLSGAWTYDLFPTAGHHEIAYRDQFRITARRKHPVLATHRCPGMVPREALAAVRLKARRKARPEKVPF